MAKGDAYGGAAQGMANFGRGMSNFGNRIGQGMMPSFNFLQQRFPGMMGGSMMKPQVMPQYSQASPLPQQASYNPIGNIGDNYGQLPGMMSGNQSISPTPGFLGNMAQFLGGMNQSGVMQPFNRGGYQNFNRQPRMMYQAPQQQQEEDNAQ
jgi:hypothetical protein